MLDLQNVIDRLDSMCSLKVEHLSLHQKNRLYETGCKSIMIQHTKKNHVRYGESFQKAYIFTEMVGGGGGQDPFPLIFLEGGKIIGIII